MSKTTLCATAIATAFATYPYGSASAACNATVNGQPMSEDVCALATRVYGSVTPGHYWLDERGNWGRAGSAYAEGICSTMPIAAAVAPGPTVGSAATPAEMATARTTWTLTPAHPS